MNHIDNNPDINLVIARYLSGNATSEEIERLREWIEQSPEIKRIFMNNRISGRRCSLLLTSRTVTLRRLNAMC